jgi:hypothetical protein
MGRHYVPTGPSVRLTAKDFVASSQHTECLSRDMVPEVPDGAEKSYSPNGDLVFDHEGRRWRFGPGGLKFYCVYRPEELRAATHPWAQAYAA